MEGKFGCLLTLGVKYRRCEQLGVIVEYCVCVWQQQIHFVIFLTPAKEVPDLKNEKQ